MGICSSSSSTQTATAKLILQDGRLKEYPYPIKASYVIGLMAKNDQSFFICDSDDLDFDGIVTAVGEEDDLLPGQLYFALPLARLRTKLHAQDMAALALKASSALTNSGNGAGADFCGFRRSAVSPAEEKDDSGDSRASRASRALDASGRRRGRRRGKFAAMLTAIPE